MGSIDQTQSNWQKNIHQSARLVSAFNMSTIRFSVDGNPPTRAMSTYRALISVLPTWDVESRKVRDELVLRVCDFTKADLQANPSQRLIMYKQSPEFLESFAEFIHHPWQAIRKLSGGVEAGRYWHHAFVPWLTKNIFQLQQSMEDTSLPLDKSKFAAIALCTDDILSAMLQELENEEQKITDNFTYRNSQAPQIDAKAIELLKRKKNHNGIINCLPGQPNLPWRPKRTQQSWIPTQINRRSK